MLFICQKLKIRSYREIFGFISRCLLMEACIGTQYKVIGLHIENMMQITA